MAYLPEIASIIAAGTTQVGSTSSWPLYTGHLPDSTALPDQAVALLHTEGFGDMARVDISDLGLQVLVRGQPINTVSTGYEEAFAIAEAVRDALHDFSGPSSSGGRHYPGIWGISGPFFAGFDENMRPLFSANYRVWRSRTA